MSASNFIVLVREEYKRRLLFAIADGTLAEKQNKNQLWERIIKKGNKRT